MIVNMKKVANSAKEFTPDIKFLAYNQSSFVILRVGPLCAYIVCNRFKSNVNTALLLLSAIKSVIRMDDIVVADFILQFHCLSIIALNASLRLGSKDMFEKVIAESIA